MTLRCVASDLRTGKVLAYLPGVLPDWPLRRAIGQYETATVKLRLTPNTDPIWPRATLPGVGVLHLFDDTDSVRSLWWSGWVTQRTLVAATDMVELSLATAEAYFDERYVGDVDYSDLTTGQNAIVTQLVNTYAKEGTKPGLPITVTQVTAGAGTPRPFVWQDSENATLYERLTTLIGLAGGPEWYIDWNWTPDNTFILPTLYVGDRIGAAVQPNRGPAARFAYPGGLIDIKQLEDYTKGKGANSLLAYSSGQGADSPSSGPVVATATDFDGRPTFETRYAPDLAVLDSTTLEAFAQRAVAALAPGSNVVMLVAAIGDKTPAYGSTWRLGDDIGYQVGKVDANGQPVLCFPDGLENIGRALGYERTLTTITPILAAPNPFTDAA